MKPGRSAIVLALLALLAILGPDTLGLSDGIVAPPFSKPSWLDSSVAPVVEIELSSGGAEKDKNLSWNYEPPMRVAVTGRLSGVLLWHTPSGDFTLAEASDGEPGALDMDARDMTFKRAIGLSPFANAAAALFPSRGEYKLSIEGSGDVTMRMDGGRYGLLGTDHRGRDTATLFIRGIRISLIVGIAATAIATLLGVSLGLLSGYVGGLTDSLIMRAVDVLMSIPTLPILMVITSVFGKGLWNLVLTLSIFSWMGTARTVRAMAMSLRSAPWVEELTAIGAGVRYIIFRHLLPEALPLLLANVVLSVPSAILSEAGLSFLGLSDPRLPSWGRMLHESYTFGAFINGAWWTILPPGAGIALICVLFMNIGRRIEEITDPRLMDAVKTKNGR
ncbi:hypothetical protein FACS1894216_03810 [Synergistales bacterium]|nr:hypothetical protein FACS1894216_03810 [Synergistales bacterium]